jgi:glutamine amidotransferase
MGSGIPDRADFYFVHSYYASPDNEDNIIGYSNNGGRFASAVQKENVYGTQCHPEKSQDNGLTLLRNFAYITEK